MRKLFPTVVENIGFYVIDQCIFKITIVGVIFQKKIIPPKMKYDVVQGTTPYLRSRHNWKGYFLINFSF